MTPHDDAPAVGRVMTDTPAERDELRERLADAAKFLRRCRGTEPVEFFEEHATACEEAAALLAPQEAREPEALRQTIAEAVERLADRLYPYWRSSEGDGSDYLAVANTIDVLAGKLTAAHQERDADASCVWTCDEDGNWDTACGGMFIVLEGTPRENGMNFCCYCGRTLTEADGRAPDTQTEDGG